MSQRKHVSGYISNTENHQPLVTHWALFIMYQIPWGMPEPHSLTYGYICCYPDILNSCVSGACMCTSINPHEKTTDKERVKRSNAYGIWSPNYYLQRSPTQNEPSKSAIERTNACHWNYRYEIRSSMPAQQHNLNKWYLQCKGNLRCTAVVNRPRRCRSIDRGTHHTIILPYQAGYMFQVPTN